jgi:hypothetical protein
MKLLESKSRNSPSLRLLVVALLLIVGIVLYSVNSSQAAVPQRSIAMSDSTVNAVTDYTLGFDISAPEILGSIKLEFCSNDPIVGDPCTPPSGFDISGAVLGLQNGETGFSIYGPGTNTNTLVLSRAPLLTTATSVSYSLTGVVNPDTEGSFYARLETFASTDASGFDTDHGGIALSTNSAIQVSTQVPPYLLFCGGVTIGGFDCNNASGDYINFGNLNSGSTATATSQILSATNAANGLTITIAGSTMTSGNNVISALNAADVSRPGIGQFGMNLVANTTPLVGIDPQGGGTATPTANYGQADFFKFTSGDTIATATTADDYRKLTASYIINIASGQPVGVYATTLTYICLANF